MKKVWRWLMIHVWWHRRHVSDLYILWPAIREKTSDLDAARKLFRKHMELDPAYAYMTDAQRDAYVARLGE